MKWPVKPDTTKKKKNFSQMSICPIGVFWQQLFFPPPPNIETTALADFSLFCTFVMPDTWGLWKTTVVLKIQ